MTDLEKTIVAWLENKSIERAHEYAKRGRRYEHHLDADLRDGWISAFRLWSTDTTNAAWRSNVDDLQSELTLRGMALPFESVEKEMAKIMAQSESAVAELRKNPNRERATNEQIVGELLEFLDSVKDTPSN